MINPDDFLNERREELYGFIRVAYMTQKERMEFVDECRKRLLDLDKIDEIISVQNITHMLAEAALDEIPD